MSDPYHVADEVPDSLKIIGALSSVHLEYADAYFMSSLNVFELADWERAQHARLVELPLCRSESQRTKNGWFVLLLPTPRTGGTCIGPVDNVGPPYLPLLQE